MRDLTSELLRTDSRLAVPDTDNFFEGPEKLFEIKFCYSETEKFKDGLWMENGNANGIQYSITHNGLDPRGLRSVDKDVWQDMLHLVKCEIVSHTSSAYVDAFVLSESSLFVYTDRIILKTCGTTTLLHAVQRVIDIAKSVGFTGVETVFYTRKNFLEPHLQIYPHGNFADEVKVLDSIFENGTSHVLGRLNGDHYYLYLVENVPQERSAIQSDQTLEILMHDLDEESALMFYRDKDFKSSRNTTKLTGIQALFPNAIIDDLVFNPCGYSVNGIMDQFYYTIHVTPQSEFSFASFETNYPCKNYNQLIKQVLNIFKPGRCSVSVFSNEASPCPSLHSFDSKLEGYTKNDKAFYDFETYNVTYCHYNKLS